MLYLRFRQLEDVTIRLLDHCDWTMKTQVSGMDLGLLVTHRLLYGDLKEHSQAS